MRRIYIRLKPEQVSRLVELAEASHRHPSDFAALMVARELERVDPRATNYSTVAV